jgi:hypothetical protein
VPATLDALTKMILVYCPIPITTFSCFWVPFIERAPPMDARSSHQALVELLTDELRQLVGRGAKPMRLVTLPTLREICRVDSSLTVRQKGSLIRHYLADAIQNMNGVYEFQGEPLEDGRLRRALRLLLMFEGTGQNATNRRERVLTTLDLNYPLGQMRRPDSPERELLRLLALEIVQNAA